MSPWDLVYSVAKTGFLVQISRTRPFQPNEYKLRKFLCSDRDNSFKWTIKCGSLILGLVLIECGDAVGMKKEREFGWFYGERVEECGGCVEDFLHCLCVPSLRPQIQDLHFINQQCCLKNASWYTNVWNHLTTQLKCFPYCQQLQLVK